MRAYLQMLPRLTAEESLITSERIAMGSGVLDKQTYRSIHRRWVLATKDRTPRPAAAQRPTQPFDPEKLRALGIEVYVDGAKA